MPLDALATCLARTEDGGLHVCCNPITIEDNPVKSTKRLRKFIRGAGAHVERWASFVATLKTSGMVRLILDVGKGKELPLLTHVQIACLTDELDGEPLITEFGQQVGIEQLEWHAPALRHFRGSNLIPSPQCGSSETFIGLQIYRFWRTSKPLQLPLHTFQRLAHFKLDSGSMSPTNPMLLTDSDRPISLSDNYPIVSPSMESLETYITFMEDPLDFSRWETFTSITTPHLTKLNLRIAYTDSSSIPAAMWPALFDALSRMRALSELFLNTPCINLPALLNRRVLPALSRLVLFGCSDLICGGSTIVSWPELPPCSNIKFMHCEGNVLREHAVPAIFGALCRSEDLWTGFHEMEFIICGFPYDGEEYTAMIEQRVGRAVAHKISSVHFDDFPPDDGIDWASESGSEFHSQDDEEYQSDENGGSDEWDSESDGDGESNEGESESDE